MNAAANDPSANGTGAQYRRLWRWHFYAAFLVIPFVLWQGVTGVIYLWHEQIADTLWPELRFVEPGTARTDLDAQWRAIAPDGQEPKSIKLPSDPRRSVQFVFENADGLSMPRFVDPYRGEMLGEVPATTWLPGLTRSLHGGWPLGKPGSWLLELGACWMIVMVLSGLYLWWPRGASGAAGVLYPRLRAGSRVLWKDLHAVVGMWSSVILLLFLVTALPWTDAWGNYVLRPIQRALGQTAPAALGFGHAGHGHGGHAAPRPLALQRALDVAQAEGFHGDLELRIGRGDGPITVTEKTTGRAADERVLSLERDSGHILDRADWSDYPVMPKVISTGVDLHEGTFFGAANRIFNTLTVIALLWLVATGLIGWYKRRPGKGLSPPAALQRPWPRWLKLSALGFCVGMPLFGLSLLSVWLAEILFARVRSAAA
jgi:uncharacterized iron-regulated membrane protein